MLNLQDVKAGDECVVTWIVGEYADALRNHFELRENEKLRILQNYSQGMIIRYGNHALALDYDLARFIKVEQAAG